MNTSTKCGAESVEGHVCDREHGHDGNHRAYILQRDDVVFWAPVVDLMAALRKSLESLERRSK